MESQEKGGQQQHRVSEGSRSNSNSASVRMSRSWMIDPETINHCALPGLSGAAGPNSQFSADQLALRDMWADLIGLQREILNVEELLIMTKAPPYIMAYLAAIKHSFRRLREELLDGFLRGEQGNIRAAVDELQQTMKHFSVGGGGNAAKDKDASDHSDQTEMMTDAVIALEEYIAELFS